MKTLRFLEGEPGQLGGVELCDVLGPGERFAAVEGSERRLDADLVFLALGFVGVEPKLAEAFGVAPDTRGRLRGAPTRFTTPPSTPPATVAAARASSCGPSPKAAPQPA